MFTRILVPVVFNRNTRWSVEKAIQFANKFNCDILLLHVQPAAPSINFFHNLFFSHPSQEVKIKMKDLEKIGRNKLKNGLWMNTITTKGSWQTVLKDVIISEHIDLTVVPKSHRRSGSPLMRQLNINKLSKQTHCPVLTMTRQFNINQVNNIVVPVHDQLPLKKLSVATYLSLGTSGCICLMGAEDPSTPKKEDACLLKAYQLLNEFGKLNISCALRDNADTAAGTLAYAKDIDADLIVVDTGKESQLKGWWNKLQGKYLCRESDIPVMTVEF